MAVRPYFNYSIEQLAGLFNSSKSSHEVLSTIKEELGHRSTMRAKELAVQIDQELKSLDATEVMPISSFRRTTADVASVQCTAAGPCKSKDTFENNMDTTLIKPAVDRLESLLEFAAQTALLRVKPSRTVSQYSSFHRFEEQMQGVPGLHFSADGRDGSWLRMDRLIELKPPKPEQAVLALWLDLTSDPDKEPSLKSSVAISDLVAIGVMVPEAQTDEAANAHEVPQRIQREDFSQLGVLDGHFKAYKEVVWKKWAAEERARRKSIKLYASLFALYQQMQGNLVDTPLEFVWGIGVAIWSHSHGDIKYPLITQLVEITLDEADMSLLINPRTNMRPLLEVGAYDAHENPGIESPRVSRRLFGLS